ncbi:MAG: 50S ribosomal protein L24 [Patescibacteria group bacterium]
MMKIKRGDKVKITAGKDKGKTGKVLQVFPDRNKASLEGLNLLVKHLRPNKKGETGQRVEFPAPMNISNLVLVCPKCGKITSRVSHSVIEKKTGEKSRKKKARVCKKCGQAIDE